jgi:macrolide transport system ATP-binding/permease protein
MSWIKRLASSLRTRRMEEDLEKELEFHLEMRVREKTSIGVASEEARRQALHRFGNLTRTKEACRDESTFAWLAALRQDLRYATRNMRKNPGFAAAAVACLAMGIGANAAVFSFVNAFLFQPLPSGVVLVQRASGSPISYPEVRDWQSLNRVFDEVFAYTPGERFTIGQGPDGEHVLGETVTGNYFRTLGVYSAAGRMLASDDESRPLAVIGYQFWRNHFFGDPAIAGKTIWINREAFTIAGVAAPTFQGMLAPWSTDVWVTPYLHRDALADRRTGWMMAASRLKTGITARQATAAMNSLDAELARQYPDPQRRPRDPLTMLRRSGLSGSPVWGVFMVMSAVLMTVVGIIFLIACANVAGLLIARAAVRRREILIRLSVGASRSRLIRQLLTESLVLGLLGAVAGIVMAFAAGDALAGLMPSSISGGFHFQHGIDTHVLAYTLALSTASVLLSGLLPAFRASDQNLADAGRTQTAVGGRTPRLRQWLIVAQVASSVLVLATAGVFVRSFQKAQAADPGFDTAHLLTVDLDLRGAKYPRAQIAEFYGQLRSRVADLPGVVSVSFADVLPLGNTRVVTVPAEGEVATATVDSNYLRTMRIPLLRGREPQPDERNVAIVNAAFARRLWPGQDPIGKSIRVGGDQALQQVIGLTATGKYWSLTEPARPFLYQISNHSAAPMLCLAIRTQGPSSSLAAGIPEAIHRLAPELPTMRVQTEKERLRAWLEPERAAAVLLSILGLAALGLAITGLYALLAQLVAQRTPEIAVRMALGASRAAVVGMLLRQSVLMIFLGVSAGITAAAAVAHLLASLSGEVNPLDGMTVIGVAALLAAVGAAATFVPAYRAVSIDPVSALRAE